MLAQPQLDDPAVERRLRLVEDDHVQPFARENRVECGLEINADDASV